MGHSYAQRCTIYKNWHQKLEFEVLLKNPSLPKNQNTSTKAKKQHCNINDKTPSYYPLIIKTLHHGHSIKTCPKRRQRPTHYQKLPKTPAQNQQNNTKTTTKHHQKKTKTRLKPERGITETSPKQNRNITETSPKQHRDITKTSQKHHQNNTEISSKKDRDKTETRPKSDRSITEKSPKQHRDKTETRPRQFFYGAYAAPGHLIHIKPQIYRYLGKIK